MVTETNSEQSKSMESLDNIERIIVQRCLTDIATLNTYIKKHTYQNATQSLDFSLRISKIFSELKNTWALFIMLKYIAKDPSLAKKLADNMTDNTFSFITKAIYDFVEQKKLDCFTEEEFQLFQYCQLRASDQMTEYGKALIYKKNINIDAISKCVLQIENSLSVNKDIVVQYEKDKLLETLTTIRKNRDQQKGDAGLIKMLAKIIGVFMNHADLIMDLTKVCKILFDQLSDLNCKPTKGYSSLHVDTTITYILIRSRTLTLPPKSVEVMLPKSAAETLTPAIA